MENTKLFKLMLGLALIVGGLMPQAMMAGGDRRKTIKPKGKPAGAVAKKSSKPKPTQADKKRQVAEAMDPDLMEAIRQSQATAVKSNKETPDAMYKKLVDASKPQPVAGALPAPANVAPQQDWTRPVKMASALGTIVLPGTLGTVSQATLLTLKMAKHQGKLNTVTTKALSTMVNNFLVSLPMQVISDLSDYEFANEQQMKKASQQEAARLIKSLMTTLQDEGVEALRKRLKEEIVPAFQAQYNMALITLKQYMKSKDQAAMKMQANWIAVLDKALADVSKMITMLAMIDKVDTKLTNRGMYKVFLKTAAAGLFYSGAAVKVRSMLGKGSGIMSPSGLATIVGSTAFTTAVAGLINMAPKVMPGDFGKDLQELIQKPADAMSTAQGIGNTVLELL